MTNTIKLQGCGFLDMMRLMRNPHDTQKKPRHYIYFFQNQSLLLLSFACVFTLPGKTAPHCWSDVWGHQPGSCEENGHHWKPPTHASSCHVLCAPMQVLTLSQPTQKLYVNIYFNYLKRSRPSMVCQSKNCSGLSTILIPLLLVTHNK